MPEPNSGSGRSWEDTYRDGWTWDKVVKVTHIRANCVSTCSLDAYVKDGDVVWEEQNATCAQTSPDVPDPNPRGCPMGCVYSRTMHDPSRVKYPMKRAGPRGSGQWQRLTWDQALTEIADKLLDVAVEDGPESIIYDDGTTNVDFGIGSPLEARLFHDCLGATLIDSYGGVGDLPTGLLQMWGTYMSEGTSDDWFRSDFIMIWIGNPSYTHVSDVHYMYEAKYRGATLVTVAPDYSPSTIHSDYWLNARFGTDAALALAMCNVIVNEGLHKEAYIKEQTDLPFLVRADTRAFLRQSDVEEGGKDDIFYFWDAKTDSLVQAPGTKGHPTYTLRLGDLDPILAGEHEIALKDGSRILVRPNFEYFREHLADYSPEAAAQITGVTAANIREVAREMAAANSAMIYVSWGSCKHFHSDLFQRGMCYLLALTGNSGGKPGTGAKTSSWWVAPVGILTGYGAGPKGGPAMSLEHTPPPQIPQDLRFRVKDFDDAMTEATAKLVPVTPLIPWLYAHDEKWREIASRSDYNDPALKRPVAEFIQESFDKGWQPIWPKPPKKPKVLYFSGVNPLRRWPMNQVIRDSLWKDIETIVCCDFRMSASAMWSDYVLPSCGWYEKPGIKYTQSYIPYVVVGDRAVPPLYDSKHEWDLILMLARKIQARAKERGITSYLDHWGRERNPSTIHDTLTADGTYQEGPAGEEQALDFIMKYSVATRNSGLGENAWSEAAEMGQVRMKAVPPVGSLMMMCTFSDFTDEEPMTQFEWFINMKEPWPTLTGRQQFYIDHPWFMELGEAFVVHKEPLKAGGDFPLRLTGGHDRWSIHAIFATDQWLMRLQRGEPVVYLNVQDAAARGIADHDRVRVRNEVGGFVARAKLAPGLQPGMATIYHSREPYQFEDGQNQNTPLANPMKVTAMAGGYGQLHFRRVGYTMNHIPREAAVEVEKL